MLNEPTERPTRVDNFGNTITKYGDKKHKIVFADSPSVRHLDRDLVEVHIVESFKNFNTDMSRPSNNSCCSII